ncbi:MAG: acyl-CoA thioesterase [Lautropia sp.]
MPTDPSSPIDAFSLIHPLRVRWAEADMQGVVFNAHYLAYCDLAITEYWRALSGGDAEWLQRTFDRLYVVRSTLEYHAPARFDDQLTIACRCIRIGRTSMTFAFLIRRGGDRLVSGENVYVHADRGKSEPVPADLRARVVGYEKIAPA